MGAFPIELTLDMSAQLKHDGTPSSPQNGLIGVLKGLWGKAGHVATGQPPRSQSTPSLGPSRLKIPGGLADSERQPAPVSMDATEIVSLPPSWDSSNNSTTERQPSVDIQLDTSQRLFGKNYIELEKSLGTGAWGNVGLVRRVGDRKLFALKVFRHKPGDEAYPDRYMQRCLIEFRIGKLFRHPNIVRVFDLEYDDPQGVLAQVSEYIQGGDMYTAISTGALVNQKEIDCLFVQLVRGVAYMHSQGVAHRDLKPENLLWDLRKGLLKIIDFGSADIFLHPPYPATTFPSTSPLNVGTELPRMLQREFSGNAISLSRGVCGSTPYIAPEEFTEQVYDPRASDVWALGIIYIAMNTRKFPWQCAVRNDPRFLRYVQMAYLPIMERLPWASRNIIQKILNVNPSKRATLTEVMADWWFSKVECCVGPDGKLSKHYAKLPLHERHQHGAFDVAMEILAREQMTLSPEGEDMYSTDALANVDADLAARLHSAMLSQVASANGAPSQIGNDAMDIQSPAAPGGLVTTSSITTSSKVAAVAPIDIPGGSTGVRERHKSDRSYATEGRGNSDDR
ncbi:kinase-like protein [Gonapodya prolifera JEL478]|uniref:non-specific serine/threonine protein kinase n=1 Tax=Gonapodya prolifera (strain JEL478) TaxID=1344416 RepID=A0A139AC22_GONPJ|nr:kinase-like protein [Gonapodya prolifera JEL478]|eukprot:KXS14346.1 kinase-like protein [Gonapodya prolifera JEL478]